MRLSLIVLAILLLPLTGCGMLTPKTSLQAGPFGSFFSFSDTKDNDIQIRGAEYDPATKAFKVDEIVVRNNASDPITANVAQLQALNEQMKIHGANLIGAMQQVTGMINAAAPWVARGQVNTPLGDVSLPAGTINEIARIVAEQLARQQPLPGPPAP